MGQLIWVRVLPGDSTEDANGGVGTAKLERGILEAHVLACFTDSVCLSLMASIVAKMATNVQRIVG
jgi:hypothetical protein